MPDTVIRTGELEQSLRSGRFAVAISCFAFATLLAVPVVAYEALRVAYLDLPFGQGAHGLRTGYYFLGEWSLRYVGERIPQLRADLSTGRWLGVVLFFGFTMVALLALASACRVGVAALAGRCTVLGSLAWFACTCAFVFCAYLF